MSNFQHYIQQIQNKDPSFNINQQFIGKIDDRKPNAKKKIIKGFPPLFYAVYFDNMNAFIQLFSEEKHCVNTELTILDVNGQQLKLHPGSTVLELAILVQNMEIIQSIINSKDSELLEQRNEQGVSLLMLLCLKGLSEFLSCELLEQQMYWVNVGGQNFVHYCCYFGTFDCLFKAVSTALYKGNVEMRVALFRALLQRDVQSQTPIELCFERLDANSMDENVIKGKRKCALLIKELLFQVLSSADVKGYEQIRQDGIFQVMLHDYLDKS